MASSELTKLSQDLATQNGVTSPAPATPAPETTAERTAGISQVNQNQADAAKLGVTIPGSTGLYDNGTTTPTPVKRAIKTPTSTVAAPQTAAQIQADLLKASQGEINSINTYAAQKIEALKPTQEQRVRETSSINTLTGLAGSTEANTTTAATRATNDKENQLVRQEAAAKIQSVMSGVKTKALEMAQTAREQFTKDTAEARAQRTADLEEAVKNTATLAATGVTYDGLKATDPVSFKYLADSVGGEALLKAQFTLNRPVDQILDKKIEAGKYIITYQNPLDGKVRIETLDLGLPAQYTKTIDAGDRILAIPDNWDGDTSKLMTINKGLTPSKAGVGGGGAGAGSGTYANDLDAIIGATQAIIPTKFGQATFTNQISKARSDADKISLIASVVLGKADAATKTDFTNQAVGIKQIDKAIKMLDDGAQTGVLESGAQYTFNLAGKDYDPKLAQLNQLLVSAIQPYRNSVTGAAWGNQEDNEYQQLFGSTKYSPAELKQRLLGVKEILASKSAAALGSYVNPLGTYGDPFNTGSISTGSDIASRVDAAGFDYQAMKADGLSDSAILSAIGQ